MGQQRHCAPWGHTLTPSPGVPLGLHCRPSPACLLPPRLPDTAAGGAEWRRAADGLASLAGAGGSTDSDYGGGRYRRGCKVGSGIVGWDGWCVCPPAAQHPTLSGPTGRVAETGTIAGIASALAMALIGAVSSYISYQQKKFCFSIQRKSPPTTSGTQSKHPPLCSLNPAAIFSSPWSQEGVTPSWQSRALPSPQPPHPVRRCTGRNPPATTAPGPAAVLEDARSPSHAPTDSHSRKPKQGH